MYLVNLCNYSIQDFPLKRPKHDGFVFNWIDDEATPWLDETSSNVIYGGDRYYKPISVRTTGKKLECFYTCRYNLTAFYTEVTL